MSRKVKQNVSVSSEEILKSIGDIYKNKVDNEE